jgi:hypothetical protein
MMYAQRGSAADRTTATQRGTARNESGVTMCVHTEAKRKKRESQMRSTIEAYVRRYDVLIAFSHDHQNTILPMIGHRCVHWAIRT